MTITVTPVGNTQTFGAWLSTTNRLANIISQNTVTTDATTGGSLTTGNGFVNGYFGANYLYAYNGLVGGNVTANGELLVLSNTKFQYSSANLLSVTGNSTSYGIVAAVNTFTLTSNTITLTGNATFSNTVTITGNATFSNTVTITGNATFANNVTFTGNVIGNFNVTGNATFQNSTVINVSSSSDALRITQTGAGNALVVEDSANPDATPFVIDNGGRLVAGYTSSTLFGGASFIAQFMGFGTSYPTTIGYAGASALGPKTSIVKNRSADWATNTIVQNNDSLGDFSFTGADGTGFIVAAQIAAAVDGTPGTNDMPGRLVFSTTADGASSPTERMRISSNGNVSIGNSSPQYKLDVHETTTATATDSVITTRAANGAGIYRAIGSNATYAAYNALISTQFDGSEHWYIGGGGTANTLTFRTSATERMRIAANGNIGVSTLTPSYKLDIVAGVLGNTAGDQIPLQRFTSTDSNADYLEITNTRAANGTSWTTAGTRLQQKVDSTWMSYIQFNGNSNDGGISFGTGTTATSAISISERMRINGIGNVGIGTNSPNAKLHVSGGPLVVEQTGAGYGSIEVGGPDGALIDLKTPSSDDYDFRIQTDTSGHSLVGAGALSITLSTNTTERMRIDASGNVGIGNTSPDAKLTVTGAANVSGNAVFGSWLDVKSLVEVESAPTISAGTLTLDLANSNIFDVALNGNITTLTINNVPATVSRSISFVLILTADGTPRTVIWPASFRWPDGTAPTLTSTNAKRDIFAFFTTDNGTSYNAFITGQNI